ncbi:MAG: IPT/TIG domain-containing protein [Legionella sp.]|nr:IPT/TIG domain-containing protein [Legionella sp.]
MQINKIHLFSKVLLGISFMLMMTAAQAGSPLWTFAPLTATTVVVPENDMAVIQYRVTNQSYKTHTLTMKPVPGVTQVTTGMGVCGNPFVLRSKESCVLSLLTMGSDITNPINDGPVVCQQGSELQCYRPAAANILRITQGPPRTDAVITVSNSPLTLAVNGASGQLTINNTSFSVIATNITSDFTGTALDGNVTETGNTCASVAPGASCTLTYTPGNTAVPQTNFTIQGSNTNAITAAIEIESGSTLTGINPSSGALIGGTSVTLTGTVLTGATAVRFDGIAATSVNVINSTTVTAVTPARATVGAVDVVIDTPAGGGVLTNGYTYVTTAAGQPSGGGVIACTDGGLQNLIVPAVDNSVSIIWGAFTVTNAQSDTNGATNTATIVTVLGAGAYAAQLCNDFAIDSQGNTPCQAGNTCYSDWFLPARNQLNCMYTNRVAIGGFSNGGYWSSTEFFPDTARAWRQVFSTGIATAISKGLLNMVRCARTF